MSTIAYWVSLLPRQDQSPSCPRTPGDRNSPPAPAGHKSLPTGGLAALGPPGVSAEQLRLDPGEERGAVHQDGVLRLQVGILNNDQGSKQAVSKASSKDEGWGSEKDPNDKSDRTTGDSDRSPVNIGATPSAVAKRWANLEGLTRAETVRTSRRRHSRLQRSQARTLPVFKMAARRQRL